MKLPFNEAVRASVAAGSVRRHSASVAAPSVGAGLRQVNFPFPEREFHVRRHRERYRSHAKRVIPQFRNSGGKVGQTVTGLRPIWLDRLGQVDIWSSA